MDESVKLNFASELPPAEKIANPLNVLYRELETSEVETT